MAELTFKSAGVSTREIDLSGPTPQAPQGIPAGIIGTSVEGPAFVPLTFGSFADFVTIFGNTDGKKFGPLAVNEWMRSSRAGTYIRVLGIGDGKKRDTGTGIVTNAGFTVGDKTVQDNGFINNNPYANASSTVGIKGRTYFLGTFMSESNGSTIFSEAGIQGTASPTAASATIMPGNPLSAVNGRNLILTNADGTSVTLTLSNTDGSGAGEIQNNGNISSTATFAQAVRAACLAAVAAGTLKMTVSALTNNDSAEATVLTLTQNIAGLHGNTTIAGTIFNNDDYYANTIEKNASSSGVMSFTGGTSLNQAVPILRGVVLLHQVA